MKPEGFKKNTEDFLHRQVYGEKGEKKRRGMVNIS
jgi:hypothetical protein